MERECTYPECACNPREECGEVIEFPYRVQWHDGEWQLGEFNEVGLAELLNTEALTGVWFFVNMTEQFS